MDMSSFRHEGNEPGVTHLDAIAHHMVRLMCVATSGYSETQEEHYGDLSTLLDLIAIQILQHNHQPGNYDAALEEWDRHYRIIRELFEDERDKRQ